MPEVSGNGNRRWTGMDADSVLSFDLARELRRQLLREIVSFRGVAEFFNIARKRFAKPMSVSEAEQ